MQQLVLPQVALEFGPYEDDRTEGALPFIDPVRIVEEHEAAAYQVGFGVSHVSRHRHSEGGEALGGRCLLEHELCPGLDGRQPLEGRLEGASGRGYGPHPSRLRGTDHGTGVPRRAPRPGDAQSVAGSKVRLMELMQ